MWNRRILALLPLLAPSFSGCSTRTSAPAVGEAPATDRAPSTAAGAPLAPASEPRAALRLVYQADVGDPGSAATTLEKVAAVVRRRVELMRIAGASVRAEGGTVVLDLPAGDEETIARIQRVVVLDGRFGLHLVDAGSPWMKRVSERVAHATPADPEIRADLDLWSGPETDATRQDPYLRAHDEKRFVTPQEAEARGCFHEDKPVMAGKVECAVSGRQILADRLAQLAAEDSSLAPADDRVVLFEQLLAHGPPSGAGAPAWRTYYAYRDPVLTNADLAGADVVTNPVTGNADVVVTLTDGAKQRFADFSRQHVGDKVAFVTEPVVLSAPVLMSAIEGGRLSVTMGAGDAEEIRQEAEDLAVVLRSGPLPAAIVLSSSAPIER